MIRLADRQQQNLFFITNFVWRFKQCRVFQNSSESENEGHFLLYWRKLQTKPESKEIAVV